MTLREKQSAFVRCLVELMQYAHKLGYELTLGRGYVTPEANKVMGGVERSLHTSRLAIDLNLFKAGKYLTQTADHEPLGLFWEQLGEDQGLPLRWGGRFNDGNHYSLEHGGMK